MKITDRDGPFSVPLLKAIESRLQKKEKTILLVNRRGYAPTIQCQSCATVLTCTHCKLGLTYHTDKTFRCHRCDTLQKAHNRCPSCKKNSLAFSGLGTQKIEVELMKRFPDAKLCRLDRDTAKNAKDMESILTTFRESADLLVGTQMIAKGHHIEEVTLVGVLGIDSVLNIPDYKSPERTFQLLTQVSGRAGRGQKPGEVYIQTYQSDHYAIQHASRHDEEGFYEDEIAFREALHYPPFSELIQVILSSTSLPTLKHYAEQFKVFLSQQFSGLTQIHYYGPCPAPIEQIRLHKRMHVVLKVPHQDLEEVKNLLFMFPPPPSSVRVIVDIDAQTLL
jgi:primosomal protein N' (replication factor Y)